MTSILRTNFLCLEPFPLWMSFLNNPSSNNRRKIEVKLKNSFVMHCMPITLMCCKHLPLPSASYMMLVYLPPLKKLSRAPHGGQPLVANTMRWLREMSGDSSLKMSPCDRCSTHGYLVSSPLMPIVVTAYIKPVVFFEEIFKTLTLNMILLLTMRLLYLTNKFDYYLPSLPKRT